MVDFAQTTIIGAAEKRLQLENPDRCVVNHSLPSQMSVVRDIYSINSIKVGH